MFIGVWNRIGYFVSFKLIDVYLFVNSYLSNFFLFLPFSLSFFRSFFLSSYLGSQVYSATESQQFLKASSASSVTYIIHFLSQIYKTSGFRGLYCGAVTRVSYEECIVIMSYELWVVIIFANEMADILEWLLVYIYFLLLFLFIRFVIYGLCYILI